jgi:hypothetical protein
VTAIAVVAAAVAARFLTKKAGNIPGLLILSGATLMSTPLKSVKV